MRYVPLALPLIAAVPALAQTIKPPQAPPQYQMTIIGAISPPTTGPISFPLAISNAGRVAGYAYTGPNYQALSWQNGAFASLPGLSSFTRSFANGVNTAGRTVGAGIRPDGSRALMWSSAGVTDLGTLGGAYAAALSLNDFNQVVGYSTTAGETQTRAFLYQSGSMQPLASLPGAIETIAYDISNTGYIAGTAVTSAPAAPILWSSGTPIRLPIPATARTGAANAVNNSGIAVGAYEINLATGAFAAAMWTSGVLSNLGNLGGPTPYAVAADINNRNQVVGTSADPTGLAGFLWSNGRMYNLSSLIPGHPGLRITSASAINDSGQIAAAALIAGRQTAVLLSPIPLAVPSPASLSLLLAAGVLASRRRR